ncbi:MAG: hypothetical protein LBM77_07680, partial [Spirochaetaceae bacterium]|nr:hypothetical protein [Spirochaetaceae bacterium]
SLPCLSLFLIQYYKDQHEAGGAGQSFERAFESCCHRFVGRQHIKTPPKAELSTARTKDCPVPRTLCLNL